MTKESTTLNAIEKTKKFSSSSISLQAGSQWNSSRHNPDWVSHDVPQWNMPVIPYPSILNISFPHYSCQANLHILAPTVLIEEISSHLHFEPQGVMFVATASRELIKCVII